MLVPKLRDTLRLEEVGDVGSKTTWQLRQNSGASVIRYLKMIKDDRQVQPWRKKTECTVHPVE